MSTGASSFGGTISAPPRALQRSLDRFLDFYNTQRAHCGYRLRGRLPATVFHGAEAV